MHAILLAAALATMSCHRREACTAPTSSPTLPPDGVNNILVILSDDVGIDKTGVYGEHPAPAPTPNIDALAAEGVLFRNAYANPTCSPSRASLLTGRHASRTGIGRWIYAEGSTDALPLAEVTIPELLREAPETWSTALFGKWHLSGFDVDDPASQPLLQGFQRYQGVLANPMSAVGSGHTPRSYSRWERVDDGELSWTKTYLTDDTTCAAAAAIATLPPPWFIVVAYSAAHEPLHAPPDDYLDVSEVGADSTDLELYEAMVESLDTAVGRLLDGIHPDVRARTTIVYATDNGTPKHGITAPWNERRGKNTVYEGGVNVPFIVVGPPVAAQGVTSDAFIHFVDLFPTVAELAGVDTSALRVEEGPDEGAPLTLDGLSIVPYLEDPDTPSLRDTVYTEGFYPNGDQPREFHDRTLRDAGYKLMRIEEDGVTSERFYRFDPDAIDEGDNLFVYGGLDADAEVAYARLHAEMDTWLTELPDPE